jgi:hypothetical protein
LVWFRKGIDTTSNTTAAVMLKDEQVAYEGGGDPSSGEDVLWVKLEHVMALIQ